MAWAPLNFGVKLSCSQNLSHQEAHAMDNISQANPAENHLSDALNYFFRTFLVASILKRVGASQTKHISALDIFRKLFELIFARKNFYMASILDKDKLGMSKSTVSRFLTSSNINWLRFLVLLAKNVISSTFPGDL